MLVKVVISVSLEMLVKVVLSVSHKRVLRSTFYSRPERIQRLENRHLSASYDGSAKDIYHIACRHGSGCLVTSYCISAAAIYHLYSTIRYRVSQVTIYEPDPRSCQPMLPICSRNTDKKLRNGSTKEIVVEENKCGCRH
jgi:hypothetical protein